MAARWWLVSFALAGALSVPAPALAQEAASKEEASDETPSAAEPTAEATPATEGDGADETKPVDKEGNAALVADAEKGSSPVEDPGKTYKFIGARYRYIIVPKFFMGLFGDGGTTLGVHSFGAEFALRRDAFEYNFGLWYAAYSMDPTPFKAKSDGNDAWELVESNIKVLYLTADFLWSHDFSPEFALNYGMGAGLGVVWGPLYRNQATPANNTGDFSDLRRCARPGDGPFCGNDNDHYDNYEEPSWANGGSKPVIFPWLALQTGFRYKPHRNFVARFDTGFSLSGFFLGVGADYGL